MKVIITADDFTVPAGTVLDVGPEVPRAFEGKCVVVASDDGEWEVYRNTTDEDFAKRIVSEASPAIVAQNAKPKRA